MMLRVLTPVFPPHIKPVRDGWYLTCRVEDSGAMSIQTVRHWNGTVWCYEWGPICVDQTWSWRGLSFDPAAAIETTIDVAVVSSQSVVAMRGVLLPGASCE